MPALNLSTTRLLLRAMEENDYVAVHAYMSLSEVMRYRTTEPHTSLEQTYEFVLRTLEPPDALPRTKYVFAILLGSTSQLIGDCFVRILDPTIQEGMIGYTLHPDYWNQGYTTEAVQALLEYSFSNLGLHRIFAECHVENRASARVMKKVGMRQEGLFREFRRSRGVWWDILHYAILDHEWQKQKSSEKSAFQPRIEET